MSEGSQRAEIKSCTQLQEEYSVLIRDQMQKRGVSVRKLVNEGVIRRSHRNRFFERIAEGSLPIAEFHAVSARLEIDSIRAAITVQCFSDPASYEDPCCETSALVAIAMATHLPSELAACEGTFETIRDELCNGIAKNTSSAIAKYHRKLEDRRNGGDFDFAYG